jgi:hypothetical protein
MWNVARSALPRADQRVRSCGDFPPGQCMYACQPSLSAPGGSGRTPIPGTTCWADQPGRYRRIGQVAGERDGIQAGRLRLGDQPASLVQPRSYVSRPRAGDSCHHRDCRRAVETGQNSASYTAMDGSPCRLRGVPASPPTRRAGDIGHRRRPGRVAGQPDGAWAWRRFVVRPSGPWRWSNRSQRRPP